MKDPIVAAIHRERAKFAKRFNYDVGAIGDAIRRSQAESGAKFINRQSPRKKPSHRKTPASK
jgi:hypothetical protein